MLFYILISIVFIAELVIAISLILHFIKLSKMFRMYNSILEEAKPQIKSITETGRKISEQLTELTPIFVDNIKNAVIKLVISNLKSALTGFLLLTIRQRLKKSNTKI